MSQPSPPASLAAVAAALRRRRERRGASIDEASVATRIRVEYLRALEAAAPMDAYPGEAYARFFVREYARFLGVEPEGAVGAFVAAQAAAAVAREAIPIPEAARPGRIARSRVPPRPVVVALVALLVVIPGVAVVLRSVAPTARIGGAAVDGNQPKGSPGVPRASGGGVGEEGSASSPGATPLQGLATVPSGRPLLVGETPDPGTALPAAPLPELPGGGRIIFPDHRVVAYYGVPGSTTLGVLGEGTPDEVAVRLVRQAGDYDLPRRPVLPAFELIASLATSSAGQAGLYRHHLAADTIDEYLSAIRKVGGLLILDVQPGRAGWLSEAKAYERWLKEPDVELALDPEWKLTADELPLHQVGTIDWAAINRVSGWLARLVAHDNLPQKLLVIHQFTSSMVTGKARVKLRAGLAITFDIDGFGSAAAKRQKWRDLARDDTRFFHGLKLFYVHDPDLLSPGAVLGMGPRPDLVVYQ
jgi:hypothetical protein